MESAKPFSLPEMMQRILQHPTATFSSMQEGTEKIRVQMPVVCFLYTAVAQKIFSSRFAGE